MSDEPSGAIDRTFADGERESRDQITEKLAGYNRAVEPGDFAIDLVYHRPVFVRGSVADTCVAYWEDGKDFDLTTYKVHPFLPVTPDDAVFECVYLPTKPGDIRHEPADKTYDFPAGRLARVPVENLWDSETRYQDDQKAALLAAIFAAADDMSEGAENHDTGFVKAVARSVFGDDVVDDAIDRAGIEE